MMVILTVPWQEWLKVRTHGRCMCCEVKTGWKNVPKTPANFTPVPVSQVADSHTNTLRNPWIGVPTCQIYKQPWLSILSSVFSGYCFAAQVPSLWKESWTRQHYQRAFKTFCSYYLWVTRCHCEWLSDTWHFPDLGKSRLCRLSWKLAKMPQSLCRIVQSPSSATCLKWWFMVSWFVIVWTTGSFLTSSLASYIKRTLCRITTSLQPGSVAWVFGQTEPCSLRTAGCSQSLWPCWPHCSALDASVHWSWSCLPSVVLFLPLWTAYPNQSKQTPVLAFYYYVWSSPVLGPLLFLIYYKDIPSVTSALTALFADDTLLFHPSCQGFKSSPCCPLQADLDALSSWAIDLNVSFNALKSVDFCLGHHPSPDLLQVDGVVIPRRTEARHLGVVLSVDLRWNSHIDHLLSVTAGPVYICQKLAYQHRLPSLAIRRFYIALVRTRLEYCNAAWCGLTRTQALRLEKVQVRVTMQSCLPLSGRQSLAGFTRSWLAHTVVASQGALPWSSLQVSGWNRSSRSLECPSCNCGILFIVCFTLFSFLAIPSLLVLSS